MRGQVRARLDEVRQTHEGKLAKKQARSAPKVLPFPTGHPIAVRQCRLPDPQGMTRALLASCISDCTRRMYGIRLAHYWAFAVDRLDVDTVGRYMASVRGLCRPQVVNQTLSAIRRAVTEARVLQWIPVEEAEAIRALKYDPFPKPAGGFWLSVEQYQALLKLPDRQTIIGTRDAVLIGLMAGCGLRRREAAGLTWDRYQERGGRQALVELVGKGRKLRTVPVPRWLAVDMDAWRPLQLQPEPPPPGHGQQGGWRDPTKILGGMTHHGVWWVTKKYAQKLKISIAPHDLRRTLAKLMRQAGADLEQIQFTLGHSSLAVTERYLGATIEMAPGKAAVDRLDEKDEDDD